MKVRLAVNGACGRMGLRLVQLAHEDPELDVVAALDAPHDPRQGQDIGLLAGIGTLDLPVTSQLPLSTAVDVVVDFSLPEGTMTVLRACLQRHVALVIATTGHNAEQRREIEAAAHEIAVLMAPNMSLAMNVLMKLLAQAAQALQARDFDVEILERHHRFKKDAPSGTALKLAQIIQKEMDQQHLRHGRLGQLGERPRDEIGIHALRVGDNVGEHTIVFSTLGETLELTHRAQTRDCYVRGALQAAKFLANRPAGWYAMGDVLRL
jgi:4-hydroxy-tetrahydrodipicolinate reductase